MGRLGVPLRGSERVKGGYAIQFLAKVFVAAVMLIVVKKKLLNHPKQLAGDDATGDGDKPAS